MDVVTTEAGTVRAIMKAHLYNEFLQESVSADQKQTFRELTSKKFLSIIKVKLLRENDRDLPGIQGHAYTVTIKWDISRDLVLLPFHPWPDPWPRLGIEVFH